MRLELKNVGKIRNADIELNGITVIAGENNTGKSTVGKMLFCIFSSFYKIEEQISEERQKTIARAISNYYHETSNRLTRRFAILDFAKEIVEHKSEFRGSQGGVVKALKDFYLGMDSTFEKYLDDASLERLALRINSILNIKDEEIRKIILRKRLDAEFAMKVGHLNNPDENSKINLSIKDSSIEFQVSNHNDEITINSYISLIKDIIYIDDPFVLDNLNIRIPVKRNNIFEHREDLLNKVAENGDENEFSAIDELVAKQKLEKIFETMKGVCDGDLLSADESGNYVYKTEELNGNLEIVNLSTGMKNFVILRKLLQNGSIDENGVLILDEPEIHLHPEWQLKFAEIIVLIQREFGTNILLNTHSPYFLNAIEVYSEKYGIGNKCKYYLTREEDRRTDIIDVTERREDIYKKLAKPLQDLESLEYKNGDTIR